MTRIQHCCSLIGVACLLIVVSGQAWSQETPVANASAEKEDSLALQEVTVVARRREESLQRIPDSVTAFQAADLERAQVDRLLVTEIQSEFFLNLGRKRVFALPAHTGRVPNLEDAALWLAIVRKIRNVRVDHEHEQVENEAGALSQDIVGLEIDFKKRNIHQANVHQ